MKKIMIIAAVVAFSAVANAATVTWSALATGTKLSDGSTAAGVALNRVDALAVAVDHDTDVTYRLVG